MIPNSTETFIFGSNKFFRPIKNRLYQRLYHKIGVDPVYYLIERCVRVFKKHRYIDEKCLSQSLIDFKTIRPSWNLNPLIIH